jgi:hypothetical protein
MVARVSHASIRKIDRRNSWSAGSTISGLRPWPA